MWVKLLDVIIYDLLVELRRELQPVGVDATQPLQPFPDGNGHILLCKIYKNEEGFTSSLIIIKMVERIYS